MDQPLSLSAFRAALKLPAEIDPARADDMGKVFSHVLNDLAVDDLADVWSLLVRMGARDSTPDCQTARSALDMLWLQHPERGCDTVLAIVRRETDRNALLSLGEGPLFNLLDWHLAVIGPRVLDEARSNAVLRRLLASWTDGCAGFDDGDDLACALAEIADPDGWYQEVEARLTSEPLIDIARLSDLELAACWLDQWSKPLKDLTQNWSVILDAEADLAEQDPAKLLRVVAAMVRTESSESLLSVAAMSPVDRLRDAGRFASLMEVAGKDAVFGQWLLRQNLSHWTDEDVQTIRSAAAPRNAA